MSGYAEATVSLGFVAERMGVTVAEVEAMAARGEVILLTDRFGVRVAPMKQFIGVQPPCSGVNPILQPYIKRFHSEVADPDWDAIATWLFARGHSYLSGLSPYEWLLTGRDPAYVWQATTMRIGALNRS